MVSLIKYERSKSMNDTPELDEALDQASETLTSEEEQEVEPQETPQEETKPEEQLEEEETFAQKPELEGKSPEELEEIYHSWNKAYTQKRQAEKQELARMAERLQELEQQIPQEPEIPLNQMTPE
jgi:DNA repair ATPase RecN